MLRQRLFLRLLVAVALFYAVYILRSYYTFQRYLSTRALTFSSFPSTYALTLNISVAASEEPPLDFPYPTVFLSPPKIPRIIHYVWFGDLYPDHNTSVSTIDTNHSPHRCHLFNPASQYEYKIWNSTAATTFLTTHYPWFLPTYTAYAHPIQRVDALKYFILLHHGGVYMDFDIACRRPVEPLLQFPAWFPEASPLGVNNDLMASRPGHPIMHKMVQGLKRSDKWWGLPWLTIFLSTGPMYASGILKAWFQAHGQNVEGDDAFFILPRIFYSESHTFFGHRAGGSWHGNDVKVILWVVERPWVLVITFGVVAAVVLAVRRKRRAGVGGFRLEGDKMAV